MKSPDRQDHLVDYFVQGKRSYYLASTFDQKPYDQEAPILRRLSEEFELCTYGLNRVRLLWEQEAAEYRSRTLSPPRDDAPPASA